ncbi:glycosyltransferase [bacterium]|nr:glycosyltransferase [bacterium]
MMTKPRVVHVYKDIYPPVQGGIERTIYQLARLCAPRFDISVIVARRGRGLGLRRTIEGSEVIEVASLGRLLSTPLAPGFISALRRSRADLFHFHIPHPTGEVAYLLSGLSTPAVATYHSDVVRQKTTMKIYGPLFQRFLSRMRVIMPTSGRYLDSSEPLRAHRDRCRVVPLGIPLEDYELNDSRRSRATELRAQYGQFALFLGMLRAYKGLPYLLDALARLPGARALIAGEGPMQPALREQAARLGLGDRVVFLGRVDDEEAVALLHAAAIFVMPSHQRSEAFGLSQIEAMTCGLPVVSTDLPTGVPEVNRNGETGLIVPPADPEALAAAMRELLSNPGLRAGMGEAGRRRARDHYRAETMADEVMKVYDELLNRES